MIVHCTQKLAKKLDNVCREKQTDNNPLGDWHANLYVIDRRQCLMFCHDKTRFVLFKPLVTKKDFYRLDFWFNDLFANTMLKLGYEMEIVEKALSNCDSLRFDTVCDRSVQGSMRTVRLLDLEGLLVSVPDVMGLPVYSVSALLNERPVTVKGMKQGDCIWPDRGMRNIISTLK